MLTCHFSDKKEKDEKGESQSFSEMLKKVQSDNTDTGGDKNKDASSGSESENGSEGGENSSSSTSSKDSDSGASPQKEETDYVQAASDLLGRGKYFMHTFTTGWSETWQEMISGPPEEIKKTVSHAALPSHKKKKKKINEDGEEVEEEEEEEEAYTGSQAMVLSDSDKSTWEAMQERLQDSPLIQEMMKNTRKFKKQAASTDIGQKAAEVGGNVQDKIHVSE